MRRQDRHTGWRVHRAVGQIGALRHCYTGTLPATAGRNAKANKPSSCNCAAPVPGSCVARTCLVPVSYVSRTCLVQGGACLSGQNGRFGPVSGNSGHRRPLEGSADWKEGCWREKLVSRSGRTATESRSRCRDGHPERGGMPHQGNSTLIPHSAFFLLHSAVVLESRSVRARSLEICVLERLLEELK